MNNDKKPISSQSGFTLIEVLVAMLVLTVGLLTIAGVFANGMRVLAGTPMQLAAKELAATEIDNLTIAAETGQAITSSNGPVPHTICPNGAGPGRNCQEFGVQRRVVENTNGVQGLAHVEVIVTYMAGGVQHRYVKTTNLSI
jgi:prepilin-type N-terminal cleavage/methylation domain-containing protein